MSLSKIALLSLKGSKHMRCQIADSEACSLETVNRWIRQNNSMLTKASILAIIRQETGLTVEQILEDVSAVVA